MGHSSNSDFLGRIQYLTATQGGRSIKAFSGYRPHIEFTKIRGLLTSGKQEFIGKEYVCPGDVVDANITTVMSNAFVGLLNVNDQFLVGEGYRVVGHGIIKRINRHELSMDSIIENLITEDTIERCKFEASFNARDLWQNQIDGLTYLRQVVLNLTYSVYSHKDHQYRIALDRLITTLSCSSAVKKKIYELGRMQELKNS
jgi:hypothetical protein